MSDQIKIQTSSPDQLAGGQAPLTPDAEAYSRNGHNQSQVFPLSGRTGVNVEGRNAGLCKPAANNRDPQTVSGMAVDSPVAPTIKQVDHKVIAGSHGAGSDFRQKAHDAVLPNQPAPRQSVGQAPLSGRTPSPSAPTSFPGNLSDSDQGN